MRYEVIDKNEKHVDAIAKAAKGADALYLATDPDREGEAISWHIAEILKERGLLKDKALHRVVFTEITPRAIKEAIAHPRQVSGDLVNAQQARRALDYLVGFNLSPVLWRKVQRGLSAGRVQSPALRMIVEREEEIEAFKAREYWSMEAQLAHASQPFTARLLKLDGKKFEQFDLTNGDDAEAARERLLAAAGGGLDVSDVAEQGAQAPSGAALHHFHPAAGSRAQARLHQPHHAHRAEAVRGRGDGRRRHGRPDPTCVPIRPTCRKKR
jgi:DNA topoisomerase-1